MAKELIDAKNFLFFKCKIKTSHFIIFEEVTLETRRIDVRVKKNIKSETWNLPLYQRFLGFLNGNTKLLLSRVAFLHIIHCASVRLSSC